MFNLIRKDMLHEKKYIKTSLIVIAFVLFFLKDLKNNGVYFLVAFVILYSILGSVDIVEERQKVGYIINSLPVTRKEIVMSKYLKLIIITPIIIFILVGLSRILQRFGIAPLEFKTAVYMFSIIIAIYSINYLFYFTFGAKISAMMQIIIYVLVWSFSFTFLVELSQKGFMNLIDRWNEYVGVIFASSIIIFAACGSLAIKLYERKDI